MHVCTTSRGAGAAATGGVAARKTDGTQYASFDSAEKPTYHPAQTPTPRATTLTMAPFGSPHPRFPPSTEQISQAGNSAVPVDVEVNPESSAFATQSENGSTGSNGSLFAAGVGVGVCLVAEGVGVAVGTGASVDVAIGVDAGATVDAPATVGV